MTQASEAQQVKRGDIFFCRLVTGGGIGTRRSQAGINLAE